MTKREVSKLRVGDTVKLYFDRAEVVRIEKTFHKDAGKGAYPLVLVRYLPPDDGNLLSASLAGLEEWLTYRLLETP